MDSLRVTFVISGLVAIALTILPMPDWAVFYRPDWVALVVFYWNLQFPERFNIGTSWTLGLVLDLLLGSSLGQHALALSLASYLAIRLNKPFKLLPPILQILSVTLILTLYRGMIVWISGISGAPAGLGAAWMPLISSVLLWPWIYILLRELSLPSATTPH
ncbi:MAG TPA: rod shape-determining protein MreD [Gammaproteobacteria bacterium]|nr:rod shape-determining protein MreD [Gammaproteobacteria bacterium]